MMASAAMNLFDPEFVMEPRLGGASDIWSKDGLRIQRKTPPFMTGFFRCSSR